MTREVLNGLLTELRVVLEGLPEDFEVLTVDIREPQQTLPRTEMPVRVHLYDVWDRMPQEARDWGETLVEEEHDDTYDWRRFDAGNVRVFCLGQSERGEDDDS